MKQEKNNINPGTSAVLSFLFTGLGQIYNGEIKKGIILMCISIISIILSITGGILIGHYYLTTVRSSHELITGLILICAGVITIAILGIYSIQDAYKKASKKKTNN